MMIAATTAMATQYVPTPMLASTLKTSIFRKISTMNTFAALSRPSTSRMSTNMRQENGLRRMRGSSSNSGRDSPGLS